ncbi:hypothetical protein GCM10009530_67740 [Microbispora corallina]|uniref:DUF4190 domain-containing protein n=1 Tax=Microbispora corallina TaxID=83302 RepID=A0ABQ4G9M5_9ACTN|nr:hypothetical protein Mco01_67750 [Microbispora corallina]
MLGVCAFVLLFVCGVGTLVAVVGAVLGAIAIARNSNRGRAVAGLVLSVLTLVLAVVLGVLIYNWYQSRNLGECLDPVRYPTKEAAQRCLEGKLGGP